MLVCHTEMLANLFTTINSISVSATASLKLHPGLLFKKEKKEFELHFMKTLESLWEWFGCGSRECFLCDTWKDALEASCMQVFIYFFTKSCQMHCVIQEEAFSTVGNLQFCSLAFDSRKLLVWQGYSTPLKEVVWVVCVSSIQFWKHFLWFSFTRMNCCSHNYKSEFTGILWHSLCFT